MEEERKGRREEWRRGGGRRNINEGNKRGCE